MGSSPLPGQGISAGDAVLNFLANTTQLDQAYAKVDSTAARLEPASQAIQVHAAAWEEAGATASAAADQAAAAGETAAGGAGRAAEAQKLYNATIYEATGALVELEQAQTKQSASLYEEARATMQFEASQKLLNAALYESTGLLDVLSNSEKRIAASQAVYNAELFETTGEIKLLTKAELDATLVTEELATAEKMAGAAGLRAGEEMAAGAQIAKVNIREAQGTAMLLGEEVGIRLPRHVSRYLAALPGVGAAMEAAFSATVVLFLIQALVEGSEKLSDWVAGTFIFTEAMKESDKAISDTNKSILEQETALKKTNAEMEKFGLTAAQKTQVDIVHLTQALAAQSAQLEVALKKTEEYSAEINTLPKEVQDAREQLLELTGVLERLPDWAKKGNILEIFQKWRTEAKNLTTVTEGEADAARNTALKIKAQVDATYAELLSAKQQHDKEMLDEGIKYREALIAAEKTTGDAEIELEKQIERARLSVVSDNYYQEGVLTAQTKQKLYELERQNLEERLKLAKAKGAEGVEEQKQIGAQIEALDRRRQASIIQGYANMMEKLHSIMSKPIPLVNAPLPTEITDEFTQRVDSAVAAAEQLDIVFSGALYVAVLKAKDAFVQLNKSGLATATDLLQAQIKTLTLEIAYLHATGKTTNDLGQSVAFLSKQLKNLEQQYEHTAGKADKFARSEHNVGQQLDILRQKFRNQHAELEGWGKAADAVLADVSDAFGNAIAQWVMGTASFADAMEQALKQYLAQVAGKAAIDALYFLAWGIADTFWNPPRAGADFAAAAEFAAIAAIAGGVAAAMPGGGHGGGGGSSAGSGTGTPFQTTGSAGQPALVPVQHTNTVTHFAAGGLISQPTLAVVGDSIRSSSGGSEAILPLDDPRAMEKIAAAIGGGGPTIHVNVRGMISPDNLSKVTRQITRRVANRTLSLQASNTFRVTRRSQ